MVLVAVVVAILVIIIKESDYSNESNSNDIYIDNHVSNIKQIMAAIMITLTALIAIIIMAISLIQR